MAYIPDIEKKHIAEQIAFQQNALQELLHYLKQRSPFYKRRFAEQGIDISKVSTLKDMAFLPLTTKLDLQVYNMDFLCVPFKDVVEYTATSGTTGTPVMIALTEKDMQRLAYNESLSFQCMEVDAGDCFQLMLTLDRQFMAGMAYHSGLRKIGAAAVRTGPGLAAMQWEVIQRLQPTGLVAVPSFLLKMIAYARDAGLDQAKLPFAKILAIGETLRNEALLPNALAKKILENWDVKLYGTYASTEMQTAFTECAMGQGGHHHPELVIVELLDELGNTVQEGEIGEVTITTLGVEAMPLLRYQTGDLCRAYYEPCACGRSTMRLGPVLGRKQQMIKLKGTTLFPGALFDILQGCTFVEEFFVEVYTNEDEQDGIVLYLLTIPGSENSDGLIKTMLKHKLRVLPEIRYITGSEMQQMQFPATSRKQIRFKDLRTKLN